MNKAVILIKVQPGEEHFVISKLNEIPTINNDDIQILFGEYDLLVRIESKDVVSLADQHILTLEQVEGIKILEGI